MCRGVSSRAELCTVLHHPPWRQQDKDESSTSALVQTGAEARGQVRREGLGAVVLAGLLWTLYHLLSANTANTAWLQVLYLPA